MYVRMKICIYAYLSMGLWKCAYGCIPTCVHLTRVHSYHSTGPQGDVVFVNSQQRNTVLGWNVRSTTYLGQTVEVRTVALTLGVSGSDMYAP